MANDERDDVDLDRAAILARRRRFIALAISGLATAGCKHPSPEPCLSVPMPDGGEPEPSEPGPFVEDPGVPLEDGDAEPEQPPETEEPPEATPPEVCLKIAPSPKPCLKKKAPPQPCLLMID